ncbi:MAG TPA: TRAM domain-containing protein, partial [Bacteroidota bacterium]|nr:TRAM domain-containing protein [Bacteroidota bacterium]
YGRTDGNKVVIFPKNDINIGEYLQIKINRSNSATLFGSVHKEKMYQTRSTERMIGVTP